MRREALINARKRKNMTQDELACAVGISRAYLSNIERGAYPPSLRVAQSLSRVLGESTDTLFDAHNAHKMSEQNSA
jgi:DNA-binding XRE family transcriptional regulator